MSVFFCEKCDQLIDSDFDDSVTDPEDPSKMICSDCWEKYCDENNIDDDERYNHY